MKHIHTVKCFKFNIESPKGGATMKKKILQKIIMILILTLVFPVMSVSAMDNIPEGSLTDDPVNEIPLENPTQDPDGEGSLEGPDEENLEKDPEVPIDIATLPAIEVLLEKIAPVPALYLRVLTPNSSGGGLKDFTLVVTKQNESNAFEYYATMVYNEEDTYRGGLRPMDDELLVTKTVSGKIIGGLKLEVGGYYRVEASYSDYPGYTGFSNEAFYAEFNVDEEGVVKYVRGSHFGNYGSYWNAKVVPGTSFKLIKTDQEGKPLANVKFRLNAVNKSGQKLLLGEYITDEKGILINDTRTGKGGFGHTAPKNPLIFPQLAENAENILKGYNEDTKNYNNHTWESIFTLKAYGLNKPDSVYFTLEEVVDDDFPYEKGQDFKPINLKIQITDAHGRGADITALDGNEDVEFTIEKMYANPVKPEGQLLFVNLYVIKAKNNLKVEDQPDGGDGESSNSRGRSNDSEDPDEPDEVVIPDEEIPAGATPEDEVVLDSVNDLIPGGELPQTGGISPMLLYGLGALLTGAGIVRRRKEEN